VCPAHGRRRLLWLISAHWVSHPRGLEPSVADQADAALWHGVLVHVQSDDGAEFTAGLIASSLRAGGPHERPRLTQVNLTTGRLLLCDMTVDHGG
jgi:hypothetical protein